MQIFFTLPRGQRAGYAGLSQRQHFTDLQEEDAHNAISTGYGKVSAVVGAAKTNPGHAAGTARESEDFLTCGNIP